MKILRPVENENTKILKVKIPADLNERIDEIAKQTRQRRMEFPIDEIVARALAKAVRLAEKELAVLEKRNPAD